MFIRRGGQGYFRWQLFGLVIPLLGLVGFVASRAAFGGSRLLVCAGQASISATLDGAPLVLEGSSTVRSAEVKAGKHRLELEREGGHMSHDLEVGRWSDLLVSTGPAQCFVWFTLDHGSVRIVARFPSGSPVEVPNGANVCPENSETTNSSPAILLPVDCDELAWPDSELLGAH